MSTTPLSIIDTTLRDGEQAPGVVFSRDEKMKIAHLLSECGVSEIEVGTPGMGAEEKEDIRAIARMGIHPTLIAWARAMEGDILASMDSGAQALHISFPVSDILMPLFKMDRRELFIRMKRLLWDARCYFQHVSIGAQDASRASRPFLRDFCACAFENGARRVRLSDTLGMLNPMQSFALFQDLRMDGITGDLEFHAHNDLGMATANSLSALSGGATSVSVTVNGLGERAGNAALEEVVMALELSTGLKTSINTRHFGELSKCVATASGRKISESKPIVGKSSFLHESGIHIKALIKNRKSYELFSPETVGVEPQEFVIGKHSGSSSLEHFFEKQGITLSQSAKEILLKKVRAFAQKKKRALYKKELNSLYFEVCQNVVAF